MISIEEGSHSDLQAILDLISDAGLPTEGVSDHIDTSFVAKKNGKVVGTVMLEMYPGAALLRSLSVAEEHRGTGLGQGLTDEALRMAKERRIKNVFLLTETADDFFSRFYGFNEIPRDQVAAEVQDSVEFTEACSIEARAMKLALD